MSSWSKHLQTDVWTCLHICRLRFCEWTGCRRLLVPFLTWNSQLCHQIYSLMMHGSYKVAFDSVWGFKSINFQAEGCDQKGAGVRSLGDKGEHRRENDTAHQKFSSSLPEIWLDVFLSASCFRHHPKNFWFLPELDPDWATIGFRIDPLQTAIQFKSTDTSDGSITRLYLQKKCIKGLWSFWALAFAVLLSFANRFSIFQLSFLSKSSDFNQQLSLRPQCLNIETNQHDVLRANCVTMS